MPVLVRGAVDTAENGPSRCHQVTNNIRRKIGQNKKPHTLEPKLSRCEEYNSPQYKSSPAKGSATPLAAVLPTMLENVFSVLR